LCLDRHVPYPPERIVSLQPSATVILSALGQLHRLVACTRYCADVCPEVREGRAVVADSWTAKSDEILLVRPDLVIAAVPYQEESVSQILRAGVRFLGLAPKNLADIYTDIAMIAGVVGAGERGGQVIANMQSRIQSIRSRTRQLARPRVFCEEWGKPIIRSQRWVAELVEAAGGEFVGEPGSQCRPEAVLAEDPDITIAAWCGAGDRVPLEKIVRDRGWQTLKAVRTSRVYCISDELLNTPAPTLLQGLDALLAAIHPELVSGPATLREIAKPAPERVSPA
jgi:iron complex transport system substrate-binding protein